MSRRTRIAELGVIVGAAAMGLGVPSAPGRRPAAVDHSQGPDTAPHSN